MHLLLVMLFLFFLSTSGFCQNNDSLKSPHKVNDNLFQTTSAASVIQPITPQSKKPELFNSGFIDFQNSGQMNAAARVFRLCIGEPKKFSLPISVYSGVSGNNINTGNTASVRSNEQLVLGIINPTSGMFNISTENSFRLGDKKNLTGVSLFYQAGEKLLSGHTNHTYKNFSFFSTYLNSGFIFQTGAWEKDKENNMGVFWLLFRLHAVQISHSFEKLSGYAPDRQFFKGWSTGMGLEINNVLNIKSFYYKYVNPGTPEFEIPIYQLTFNYSMKSN